MKKEENLNIQTKIEEKKDIFDYNFEALEKICYDLYIKCNGNLNLIKDELVNIKITENVFIISLQNYINKNISKPEYALIFDKLLTLKTKEEVIKYLNSMNDKYNLKYLQSNLPAYYFYFRPDIHFYKNDLKEKLHSMLNIYQVYLKTIDEPPLNLVDRSSLEYASSFIKNFINSQTTLERYLFQNNLTYQYFKPFINRIKYTVDENGQKHLSQLYIEYQQNILLKDEIKKRDIKFEVLEILEKIKENGNNFTIFDYAMSTKYGLKELVKEADYLYEVEHLFSFQELKLLRIVLNKFLTIKRFKNFQLNSFYNETEKFIISIDEKLIEIDSDTKKNIINFLKLNEIPISIDTIKDTFIYLSQIENNKSLKK